jgi:hypothetical protein
VNVYKAIAAVQAELAKGGIAKANTNQQQGYKFRGIDDDYNALAPILAKHGLCVLPRCKSREVVERVNQKGTALFYVTVEAEFDFVCAEDGSKHTVGPMYGEAMDSGDKATNKAMSAAYKYAAMQAFAIPTEGDNDADATTHEVQPIKREGQPTSGAWEAVDSATQAGLLKLAANVGEFIETGDATGAWELIERQALNTDEKAALWTRLDSKTRTALKKAHEQRKAA